MYTAFIGTLKLRAVVNVVLKWFYEGKTVGQPI